MGSLTVGLFSRYACRLAELTLEELKRRHPEHPAATWTQTRSEPLEDTLWTDDLAQQVFQCVNHVLYERLQLLDDEAPDDADDELLHATVSRIK